MMLKVEALGTFAPERRYILDVVLRERLGLDWRLAHGERSDVRISVAGDDRAVLVPDVLFATPARDWLTARALPARPLPWRPLSESGPLELLPVVYGTPGAALVLPRPDGVGLTVDVFGSCFFMLSRYEELVVPERDRDGRFAATSSIARAEGFLGLPLADAYAQVLWTALARLWPRLERRAPEYRLAVSHDVDRPLASAGKDAAGLARQLGADALVRRDPGLAARRIRSWAALRRADHRLDPYNTFEFLMDVSERHGIKGAFYFLATEEASARDGFYTLEDPWIAGLVRRIHERGHEVGYHASFHSHRDPARTAREFGRLRRAAERQGVAQDRWGGRQHYLRWENPVTWSNWDSAGLDYDSTLAFADRVGFRAGTCHEFPVYHLVERRPLRLRERPLHVMDGTLFEYMRLEPEQAFDSVVSIARQCRRYGGTLSILWHNSSLPTSRQKRFYESLVGELTATHG